MTPSEKVQHYIDTLVENPQSELDQLVVLLRGKSINAEEAECLIAFVPIAFAHAVLSPGGVRFQPTFLVRDFDSGASAIGQLDDEPIFVAAKAMANEMLKAGDLAAKCALDIAATSAEMNVVKQLTPDGGDTAGIVLTEPLLTRVPVERFVRKRQRIRWKFWE